MWELGLPHSLRRKPEQLPESYLDLTSRGMVEVLSLPIVLWSEPMNICVGIDTGKALLEVGFYPSARSQCFANSAQGHRALLRALAPLAIDHITIEATGGYERGVLEALAQAGYAVTRLASHRATAYARALGHFAKNDRLDAQVLARMAAHITPQPYVMPSPERAELAELLRCRLQLIGQRDDNRRRLKQTSLAPCRRALQTMIDAAQRQIAALEQRIAASASAVDTASR